MIDSLHIRKVTSRADHRAFFAFPWTVYRHDPNWIPQLKSMRRELLDKQKNPAWEYMEGDYFLALRGEQVVGTIAAFVNHRHNEFSDESVGWFGAFEVLDDVEAAHALLDTALEWVRTHGLDTLRGPQTFTTHEEIGLLIDGFAPPVLLMPYHPPYYQGFIEARGFVKSMDYFSFYYDWKLLQEFGYEPRLERIVQRVTRSGSITTRPIDRKRLHEEFALFKDLYNRAWVANWGFVPMTERELDALIEGLGMIFDPDLALFAEVDGEAVGFIIIVPDFNQVLRCARPHPNTPELVTLLRALWHWKLRPKINQGRVPLMGVVQEHRTRGIDLLMYYRIMLTMRAKGYQSLDSGWIVENNQDMMGVLKGLQMQIYRTYRLYEKLTSSP